MRPAPARSSLGHRRPIHTLREKMGHLFQSSPKAKMPLMGRFSDTNIARNKFAPFPWPPPKLARSCSGSNFGAEVYNWNIIGIQRVCHQSIIRIQRICYRYSIDSLFLSQEIHPKDPQSATKAAPSNRPQRPAPCILGASHRLAPSAPEPSELELSTPEPSNLSYQRQR